MVEPDDGTGIVRVGAGTLGNLPNIGVRPAGSDDPVMSRVVGAVVVVRTFRRLFIEHSVRMHAVTLGPIVLEEDLDTVSDLAAEPAPHQSTILPPSRTLLNL